MATSNVPAHLGDLARRTRRTVDDKKMPSADDEELPTHLYQYRSLSGRDGFRYLQNLLSFGEYFFQRPENFNDPFDCLPVFEFEASDDEIRERWTERYGDNPAELQQMLRLIPQRRTHPELFEQKMANAIRGLAHDIRHNVGVACFSSVDKNILMWAHYADNHRGICLVFERSLKSRVFRNAQPVKYSKERPLVNIIRDGKAESMEKSLLTKARYWRYEHEWRWLYQVPGPQKFEREMLSGIILGASMNADVRERLLATISARLPTISIYQASIDETKFALNITALSRPSI